MNNNIQTICLEGFYICPDHIFDSTLKPITRVVFFYLCWCAENGKAIPPYKDISFMCDISQRTAHKAIRDLIEKKLIVRRARYLPNGQQTTNAYYLSGFEEFNSFLEDECKRLVKRYRQLKEMKL